MVAEFIEHTDPRWREFLRLVPHDVYHLPEYVSICAKHEDAEPLGFYCISENSVCLIPLLRKRLPARLNAPVDWCDLSSPYGYGAPLYSQPHDAQQVAAFLRAFCAAADELNICSAFLRLHPLMEAKYGPGVPLSAFVTHGETVAVDLTRSKTEMWQETRENHARDILRLQKLNFKPVVDDWAFYGEFARIYRETMFRVGATETYHFSDAYFADLKSALGKALHLCCVLSPDDCLAAGGLFTAVDRIVEYHLGGTDARFLNLAPSKLVMHSVREWGKEHGYLLLHLGGGVGAQEDQLFSFKAGFSRERKRFLTCRLIASESRYAALSSRTGKLDLQADLESAFFPPYRSTNNA
jgi:Acetyltransferase (GNAT) domain